MKLLSKDSRVVKVVALADDVIIGRRVCREGDVVEVSEAVAYRVVCREQPVARLAPDCRFETPDKDLKAASYADDADSETARYVGDVDDLFPREKASRSTRSDAGTAFMGPMVKVKGARDGRVGGVRVAAGETLDVREVDAVDGMLSGVLRRDASILSRSAVRCLDAGVRGRYRAPAPNCEIPKIGVKAVRDHVQISNAVLMEGQIYRVPEDVVFVLMQRPGIDPGFIIAAGERFSMPQRQLKEAAAELARDGLPSV
ncbi:hypothetical protein [Paludisphaera rhizosphaerae]|uniref:hypothetical protein n=1 Tax=Paludisphaera rhizosphaerae TaxID=2711216 RepID=UPI0013EC3912|nr:hypothetical protein [Paludisphaera rhizosphaerae]